MYYTLVCCNWPALDVPWILFNHDSVRIIIKTRTPARQYVYVGFSRRKTPRSSADRWQPGARLQSSVAYTISEKAIRFRHLDCDLDLAQKLISSSMSRHSVDTQHFIQMHASTRFWVILLTDRQTNKHGQKHVTPLWSEVNEICTNSN